MNTKKRAILADKPVKHAGIRRRETTVENKSSNHLLRARIYLERIYLLLYFSRSRRK